MIVSWKLECRKSLRENKLLRSSNAKLYRWIMFLMLGVTHLKSHTQILLPSFISVWKDSHHKNKSKKTNNEMSNRTRSNSNYTDQRIGSRTRSKMHNVYNLRVQNLFFPLHDAILFQGHGKSQAQYLQLGVLECKVYHNILMNTKSQVDFDCLLQLHMLCKTEEDNDMSCECCKVVDYFKEKGGDANSSNYKCLLEWNDINKTKSWVNYFALSLSNP
jgi:hypothetical protein